MSMIEQQLIAEVAKFLKQEYDIYVNLPPLKSLITSTVSLKFVGSANTMDNRYTILIEKIDELLKGQKFVQQDIETFKREFFKTIESDIRIMEENETIRLNSIRIRQKFQYRLEELSKKKNHLIRVSESLNDKKEIIAFISLQFKNYLASIRLIADDYRTVQSVKVMTPLNIDHIYRFDIATQMDYLEHFEPLLELLVRLKANMDNLYKDISHTSSIDMPLKCVNFLANCKSLLLEMKPFLINNQCAFNRLIFHVVMCQDQNMHMIANFYQNNLSFTRNLVINIYKCVWIGNLFSDYYNKNKKNIEASRRNIIKVIENCDKDFGEAKISVKEASRHLQNLREDFKTQKRIICHDKTVIMEEYIERKIAKKLNMLLKQKEQVISLQFLLKNCSERYIPTIQTLGGLCKKYSLIKPDIEKEIELLQKDPTLDDRISEMNNPQEVVGQKQKQHIFKKNFTLIQNAYLEIQQLEKKLILYEKQMQYEEIKEKVFKVKIEDVRILVNCIFEIETNLLNKYQQQLQKKEYQEKEAEQLYRDVKARVSNFLETNIDPGTGFHIINEDQRQSAVSQNLLKLDKAEYMISKFMREDRKKQQYCKDLKKTRKNLQFLFTLFQGSLSDENFSVIMNVMDFQPESEQITQKNVGKINEMLGVLIRYGKDLKKIQKQLKIRKKEEEGAAQKSLQKIHKIIRERIVMYEFLQDLYTDCLTINLELRKQMKKYDIQRKGLLLFDEGMYQHCLICYQCVQKILLYEKMISDIEGMPAVTRNYIIDDLYEPYANRLSVQVGYDHQRLLQFTLGLEEARKIKMSFEGKLKNMQFIILSPKKQAYLESVKSACMSICDMYRKGEQILQLDGQDVVIHNMNEFVAIMKQCQQHYELSRKVTTGSSPLTQNYSQMQFKNPQVEKCRNQLALFCSNIQK